MEHLSQAIQRTVQEVGNPVYYYTAIVAALVSALVLRWSRKSLCFQIPNNDAQGTHAALQLYEPSPVDVLSFFAVSNIGLFAGLEYAPKHEMTALFLLKLNLIYVATILYV